MLLVRIRRHVEEHHVGEPVVAVVEVRMKIQSSNRTARCAVHAPCVRTRNVPPRRPPDASAGPERRPSHRRRDARAQELEHGRGDVELVVQRVIDSRRQAGPPDDHGNVRHVLIGGLMIAVDPQLPERLSVIGGHDDSDVFVDAQAGATSLGGSEPTW